MRPFIGTFENKVDRKGRVSVPAKFRSVLEAEGYSGIVVRMDPQNGCIEGYGMDRLERLQGTMSDLVDVDDPDYTVALQIFAESDDLPFDPNGRVLLPDALRSEAGIDDTAVFVGLGRVFQIWNPDAFQTFRTEKLRRPPRTPSPRTPAARTPSTAADPATDPAATTPPLESATGEDP